jgi:hypothetical protein
MNDPKCMSTRELKAERREVLEGLGLAQEDGACCDEVEVQRLSARRKAIEAELRARGVIRPIKGRAK